MPENHRQRFRQLDVVQSNIYGLPVNPTQFDFVCRFGILQHMLDVTASFFALAAQLKSGGQMAVENYRKHWSNLLNPKYLLRPFTSRMRREKLFSLVESWAPPPLAIFSMARLVPLIGNLLALPKPVANYLGVLPLSKLQLGAWEILDTFDWLGPADDKPQIEQTLLSRGRASGPVNLEALHPAHLTLRGKSP